MAGLNSPKLRTAAFVLLGAALAASAWLAFHKKFGEAVIMGGFMLAAVLLGLSRDRLPTIFTFLFALAAAVNALGYVLELWHDPVWFDEAVHFFTPFTIVGALGWLIIRRKDRPWVGYVVQILLLGLAIGVSWEVFEWLIGIIGSWQDTQLDLLMDMIGSAIAAWFCLGVAREGNGESPAREARNRT